MVLGEADPVAAGRGRGPDRQALAARRARWRRPSRRVASMSGPATKHRAARARAGGDASVWRSLGVRLARGPSRPARYLAGVVARLDLDEPVVHRDRHESRPGRRAARAWWIAWASASGTSAARGGSWLHLTNGLGTSTASRLVRLACMVTNERICWPAVTSSGDLFARRVEDRADAVAEPGRGVQVHVCDASASPARSRRRSRPRPPPAVPARSGSPPAARASIGSSVEPGLPKIVVIPRSRNSSKAGVANGRHFPGLPWSFPVPRGGGSRCGPYLPASGPRVSLRVGAP